MRFSSFAPFGHFAFTAKPPVGETVYGSMRAALGGDENLGEDSFSGPMCAHLYSTAMALADALRAVEKVRLEQVPHTSERRLEEHEGNYLVIPERDASRDDRREEMKRAELLSDGCTPANLMSALTSLIGSALISIRTHDSTEFVVAPTGWDGAGLGTWKPANMQSKWRELTADVWPGLSTVTSTNLLRDGDAFIAGDVVIVDPGKLGIQESVTLTSSGPAVAGTFARHHAAGAVITTEPFPFATTSSRVVMVVVTAAVAESREWQRKIGNLLRKLLRAVDRWYIVEETVAGTIGPFYPDVAGVTPGIPGMTPLIAITSV